MNRLSGLASAIMPALHHRPTLSGRITGQKRLKSAHDPRVTPLCQMLEATLGRMTRTTAVGTSITDDMRDTTTMGYPMPMMPLTVPPTTSTPNR